MLLNLRILLIINSEFKNNIIKNIIKLNNNHKIFIRIIAQPKAIPVNI